VRANLAALVIAYFNPGRRTVITMLAPFCASGGNREGFWKRETLPLKARQRCASFHTVNVNHHKARNRACCETPITTPVLVRPHSKLRNVFGGSFRPALQQRQLPSGFNGKETPSPASGSGDLSM
jgi:hypothetical protein